MRWVGEALRGAWTALAAHPIVFASVTLAVAALNVVAPVAILSAVRKPFDFYTFNPWLKRLPEYFASDNAPLVEKLAKLPDLALFWVSAGSTYGGDGIRSLHRRVQRHGLRGPGDPRGRPRVRRARERHAAFSRRVLARRDDRPPRGACSRRRLPRVQYLRCKRKWRKMTV